MTHFRHDPDGSLKEDSVDIGCTEICWTPVDCPVCGMRASPAGRSDMGRACSCEQMNYPDHDWSAVNRRHLFDEHDSARHYLDPQGWAEHERGCKYCG